MKTNPNTIFLHELTDILSAPSSPQQLTNAIAAHRAYLAWEQQQTRVNWKEFQKRFYKV